MPTSRDVGRIGIRVMPSLARFRSGLSEALQQLERKMVINVPTKIDLEGARRSAQQARQVIQRELSDVQTVVNVTPDGVDIRTTNRQLDAVARERAAEITASVDQSSLARVQKALDGLRSGLGKIGKGAGIAGLAASLGTLGAGAAAAVVPVVQLGAALAPVGGALATLPALAAGAAAAGGALAIAFIGVGDALEAALVGNTAALAVELEKLSPAAASVMSEIASLHPQLDALRRSVQDGFFEPLIGGATELVEKLLPTMQTGLTKVSGALGDAAAELVAFASTPLSVAWMEELFASTATAINNADGALPSFLSGMRELSALGFPYLEQAGSSLETLAQRFDTWATQLNTSGEGARWIEEALDTLSQLGDIASNVGGIFSSIFSGAGDGGILTTIESLTGALDDFLASAEGQEALSGLFEGLADIGTAVAPVITALASGIGELAPIVGRLAEAFGPVLTQAIEGLVPALVALEPGITAIIEGLGEGIDALVSSGALETLGTAFSDIMTALAPLLPVFGELAALLVGALAEALIAIAPGLGEIATSLAENLAPILPELADSFTKLVEALGPLIPPLIEALLPVLEILPELIGYFSAQMGAAAEMIPKLTPFLEILIGILGWLIGVVVEVVNWVLDLGTKFWSLGDDAYELGQRVGAAIRAMRDKVVGFFLNLRDRAVEAVTGLRDRVLDRARRLRDGIVDFVTDARDRAVGIARSLRDGITDKIDDAVDAVRDLPGEVKDFFSGARDWLASAGRNVIYGLIDGINDAVGALWDRMSGIADRAREYWPFSPAKRGPLKRYPMDQAGRNLAEMLADGIASGEEIVARATEGLAGAAVMRPPAAALSGLSRPDDGEGEWRSRQPVVQVTNHYPQAEPTSTTMNRSLQYAAAIGVV